MGRLSHSLYCCVFIVFVTVLVSSDVPTKPKVYTLNLDLPPEERWMHIVKDFPQLAEIADTITRRVIPEDVYPLVDQLAQELDKYLPEPFAQEIRGIAKASGADVGGIVMANLFYEATAFCTSIVAQDTNGLIWHARNLDYGGKYGFTEMLKNITAIVHFQKGGKTVYSAVTYVGFAGIVTGQRPYGFTISIDERDQGAWWMNALVALLDRQAWPVGFLIRKTLEEETTFEGALDRIVTTDTIAEGYFIIGGANSSQGAVVTRARLQADNIWKLDIPNGRWYLVETNYDHWVDPPATDNRRTPAMKALNSTGQQNINKGTLFEVLSEPLVVNRHTTYTATMSAGKPDVFDAWVRHYNGQASKRLPEVLQKKFFKIEKNTLK
ncbi:N-acylethanolamine-hydrolyzing acid amidase [Lingula anatina]|uniref:N-acylethanolamine-hydrolyzing acid amidase n=1 Tax=Lingula anatina TaxID=7574 RepID=A0A1S3KAS7_LINAN|nr:N-acylethanolamine-hydrolyzing acid amidase [Lingula anatina]|eukprot:XP_013419592.1 N-acylethanolamine-hydrolyzing acid amidase [Lingula anatina]